MSFGVGGSDVITGIKLAVKIYELGFVEENAAGQCHESPHRDVEHELIYAMW